MSNPKKYKSRLSFQVGFFVGEWVGWWVGGLESWWVGGLEGRFSYEIYFSNLLKEVHFSELFIIETNIPMILS